MKNSQRRSILPVHDLPGQQGMLRFGFADKSRVLASVVFLPAGKLFAAAPVAQRADESRGFALGSAIAERIQGNRIRRARQWIMSLRTREHRALIVQPHQVTEEYYNQQRAGTHGDK